MTTNRWQRFDSSSCLRAARYRAKDYVLEALFTSGELYRYKRVPSEVFEALLSAESKGHYFQEHIRDHFPYQRAAV